LTPNLPNEIKIKIISLLSNANVDGWIRGYGDVSYWAFEDGTRVSSVATEHFDSGTWLETYDELIEKIILKIGGVKFSEPDIEEVLDNLGNLIEFNFKIFFKNDEITYHYIQFGDGNEAARSIDVPTSAFQSEFVAWIDNAISSNWCVTLSKE
jgi:hypothetical protein